MQKKELSAVNQANGMSGRVILSPIMRSRGQEIGLSEPQQVNSVDVRISDSSSGHHNIYS